MNLRGKVACVLTLSFLAAVLFSGCTTKSTTRLKEQNAFLAGQNAELRKQQSQPQTPGVTVVGAVQNPNVPWVAGLTLAQAIATANYLDPHAPKQIIITRDGESATLDADVLLNGTDIPLQIGDVIELR
jgi:protein involved in polysaccharide export with SLBB domain